MPFATMATPLTLLALALPFLFCFTQAPINNFWPLRNQAVMAFRQAG